MTLVGIVVMCKTSNPNGLELDFNFSSKRQTQTLLNFSAAQSNDV